MIRSNALILASWMTIFSLMQPAMAQTVEANVQRVDARLDAAERRAEAAGSNKASPLAASGQPNTKVH